MILTRDSGYTLPFTIASAKEFIKKQIRNTIRVHWRSLAVQKSEKWFYRNK